MRKYRNKKCTLEIKGKTVKFDSILEKDRAVQLVLLEKSGKITELSFQPKFVLLEGFKTKNKTYRQITYSADFRYIRLGEVIIEDAKGMRTSVYINSKKMFLSKYGNELSFCEIVRDKGVLISIKC